MSVVVFRVPEASPHDAWLATFPIWWKCLWVLFTPPQYYCAPSSSQVVCSHGSVVVACRAAWCGRGEDMGVEPFLVERAHKNPLDVVGRSFLSSWGGGEGGQVFRSFWCLLNSAFGDRCLSFYKLKTARQPPSCDGSLLSLISCRCWDSSGLTARGT